MVLDGQRRTFSISKATYSDPSGNVAGIVGIARDVTEAKAVEAARLREANLRAQMGDLFQACRTLEEAYGVIDTLVPGFFPEQAGAVYLLHASRDVAEACVAWGGDTRLKRGGTLLPDDCWGLRRGKPYLADEAHAGLRCKHAEDQRSGWTFCAPLLAHGEVLGILHLAGTGRFTGDHQQGAALVGEQASMAIANLRLRETLRNQSIRDPLTGLFNRRYAEETLDRELRRAAREKTPLSLLMIDVDHFKDFNDTLGHDAGDEVLRRVGELLQRHTRGGDVPSRLGGEELLVILPGAAAVHALKKADDLREAIAKLESKLHGRALGRITVSAGVAEFPTHGSTADVLLRASDRALYQAKKDGRNRVLLAE